MAVPEVLASVLVESASTGAAEKIKSSAKPPILSAHGVFNIVCPTVEMTRVPGGHTFTLEEVAFWDLRESLYFLACSW